MTCRQRSITCVGYVVDLNTHSYTTAAAVFIGDGFLQSIKNVFRAVPGLNRCSGSIRFLPRFFPFFGLQVELVKTKRVCVFPS